jgi:hypothetical protein
MNDLKFTTAGNYMNTNERVKELALQSANEIADLFNPGFFDDRMVTAIAEINKKFAELIVQEMLQTCEDHPGWSGRMIGEQIKQHFGVEE